MIFLVLLYLCCFSDPWNTLALPTHLRPSEILPRKQSIFIRDEDKFNTQSIYNILWSCLSRIFACTWIAVHPNIPAPGDSQWAVLRRRVAIMGYILLAPEFVILWAARQHFGARYLTEKHEKNHTGWTRAHSFFLIMGGFTLYEGGRLVRVLEAKDLEELSEAGKIKWPTITKEEIADRSMGLSVQNDRPLSSDVVCGAMHCSGGIRPNRDRVGSGYCRVCQSHWGYLLSLVGQAPRRPLFHPDGPSRWTSRGNYRGY